jgi:predicted adenylyl cyclase CyaB
MEYELKFRIKDKRAILLKLRNLNAEDLGRRVEVDISIGTADKGLRLRKFGRDGLITYKRSVAKNIRAKVREELQSEVSDIDSLIEIFRILGFPEVKRKEKIRHTFKLGDAFIMVDRLPFMGYFIEIEAKSGAALKRVAGKLGFDPAVGSCDSYDNMFLDYYIVNAVKFKDFKAIVLPTFESEKKFKGSGCLQ